VIGDVGDTWPRRLPVRLPSREAYGQRLNGLPQEVASLGRRLCLAEPVACATLMTIRSAPRLKCSARRARALVTTGNGAGSGNQLSSYRAAHRSAGPDIPPTVARTPGNQ
jgi:hypothetical protein